MPVSFKHLIDKSSMTRVQYSTIGICFLMNILDGMDVLIISYCAPAISESWSLGPEALGIVFSAGLAGMTLGALFLAPYADQFGRKKIILLSAILMGVSVLLTAYSESVNQLITLRFLSGIGIGSMLASTAALTSEYTPNKSKDFWVSFVLSGYPVGAVISGYIAVSIIPSTGWQMMFVIAGAASIITIPLIYLFLSESIEFYLKKQPVGALEKVNKIFLKMNFNSMNKLPLIEISPTVTAVKQLLSNNYKISTLQLWSALFFAFGCLYFLISWIPKLATNAGLSIELAIYAGTVFNIGAFFGIVLQGYCSSKIGLKKTISIFFLITAVLMAVFKIFIGSNWLLIIFGLLGFFIQGGFVGLYAVAARLYPTEFRTTGVGWAIGAGRLGGVLGPLAGGVLVGMGFSMSTNFIIFSFPALLAAILTYFIHSKKVS
ncbi:MAG: MFS transporter [Flavobacteriales bacterium]|jgi:AAHS family 4-hydroxybenzoate transporter-like MFS transporter|tara:strand:+ start:2040 stop:3338 length:1299 start_codon:yes stop_codon:yes gene_type:complete